MTWPAIKFVDAPAVDATVRLDLSTTEVFVAPDGFDFGAPAFQGEPDSVGVEYRDRELSLTVRIHGTKSSALATLQTLARELLRRNNWLLFQLQPMAKPVWFKTYRGQPGNLSLENVHSETDEGDTGTIIPDQWEITVPLTGKPFAYGERVTLSPFTVNNNPAAGSNPCSFVLPPILGDAPTGLRIEINPSNSDYMNGYRWMLAAAATDTPRPPVVWQVGTGDGWTAGTDTGAATTTGGTAYSGGSYRVVSFGTAGMTTRLSGGAPAALARGRYKVLVRVARSDTDSTFSFRFGQTGAALTSKFGDTVTMTRAASTAAGHATWVDLGDHNFPWGTATSEDWIGFDSTPQIDFQAARLSGSGSCNIDAFMLVPLDLLDQADAQTLFSEFPDAGLFISTGVGIWDSDDQTFWAVSQFGTLVPVLPELAGGFPEATPGMTNQLVVLQQVNGRKSSFGTDSSDDISVSSSVTVSYHPRYLNLAGD